MLRLWLDRRAAIADRGFTVLPFVVQGREKVGLRPTLHALKLRIGVHDRGTCSCRFAATRVTDEVLVREKPNRRREY